MGFQGVVFQAFFCTVFLLNCSSGVTKVMLHVNCFCSSKSFFCVSLIFDDHDNGNIEINIDNVSFLGYYQNSNSGVCVRLRLCGKNSHVLTLYRAHICLLFSPLQGTRLSPF